MLAWAAQARAEHHGLGVLANADSAEQVARAIEYGAEGIGLVRTEHMCFGEEAGSALRDALLATNDEARGIAYARLQTQQNLEFTKIFKAAGVTHDNYPITIRLLDAPPEEFLDKDQQAQLEDRVGEENLRGAPLALKTPGLYHMQAQAIFEAAKEAGFTGKVNIMLPLVRDANDVRYLKGEVEETALANGMSSRYGLHAMIETPEAVKNAGEIAKMVEGLSYGTNDLTAAALGNIKRNDVAATHEWMARRENNHTGKSPWLRISKPVETWIAESAEAARAANPNVKLGICGHQASEVSSIEICQKLGLDSISVPASAEYLIPSALIAGQQAIKYPRQRTQTAETASPKHTHSEKFRQGVIGLAHLAYDIRNMHSQRKLG